MRMNLWPALHVAEALPASVDLAEIELSLPTSAGMAQTSARRMMDEVWHGLRSFHADSILAATARLAAPKQRGKARCRRQNAVGMKAPQAVPDFVHHPTRRCLRHTGTCRQRQLDLRQIDRRRQRLCNMECRPQVHPHSFPPQTRSGAEGVSYVGGSIHHRYTVHADWHAHSSA